MYHQISRATGRLVAASNLQAPLFPIAPSAVQLVEPPTIQYTTSQLSTVADSAACAAPKKRLVPGTNVPFGTVPEALRKQQEIFLKDNDVPVFLKGGPMDAVLYRLTLFLCVVGLAGVGEFVFTQAFPKKP